MDASYFITRVEGQTVIFVSFRRSRSLLIQIGGQEHFYLETNASLVVPGEGGSMEIFASTQNPTKTQDFCARVCSLDRNKVVIFASLFVVVVVVCSRCREGRKGGGSNASEKYPCHDGRTINYDALL